MNKWLVLAFGAAGLWWINRQTAAPAPDATAANIADAFAPVGSVASPATSFASATPTSSPATDVPSAASGVQFSDPTNVTAAPAATS